MPTSRFNRKNALADLGLISWGRNDHLKDTPPPSSHGPETSRNMSRSKRAEKSPALFNSSVSPSR
jgi:hypothetical protein